MSRPWFLSLAWDWAGRGCLAGIGRKATLAQRFVASSCSLEECMSPCCVLCHRGRGYIGENLCF